MGQIQISIHTYQITHIPSFFWQTSAGDIFIRFLWQKNVNCVLKFTPGWRRWWVWRPSRTWRATASSEELPDATEGWPGLVIPGSGEMLLGCKTGEFRCKIMGNFNLYIVDTKNGVFFFRQRVWKGDELWLSMWSFFICFYFWDVDLGIPWCSKNLPQQCLYPQIAHPNENGRYSDTCPSTGFLFCWYLLPC